MSSRATLPWSLLPLAVRSCDSGLNVCFFVWPRAAAVVVVFVFVVRFVVGRFFCDLGMSAAAK